MFQTLAPHRPVPVAGPWHAPEARRRLATLGRCTDEVGALVVTDVPLGTVPDTPEGPTDARGTSPVSERSLLDAAELLGEAVGYLPEHGGDVVQNLLPTRVDSGRQTSTSSAVTLGFHTETAFHPHRPRYLLLLCLRGDPAASTTLACVDDVLGALDADTVDTLFRPHFRTRPDESFGGGPDAAFGPPMAVLTGDRRHPVLTYDAELTRGDDSVAQAALDRLTAAIEAHHTSVRLTAGDLLVVDNHRCVHGRSPFRARYDGTDRWLRRTFVVEDLAPSEGERTGRIITTTFARTA